jgi:predicted ArsR family transcriptional regulator
MTGTTGANGKTPKFADPGPDSPAERVAEALRRRGGTASAAEIGEDLGIHTSTARFHLDHLVEAGRARMGRERRATRGRPRTMFTLTADPTEGPRAYQMLAGVLVEHLARQPDAARQAERAGQEWGRRYRGEDVVELLEQIGFAPQPDRPDPPATPDSPDTGENTDRIALRHCPFVDLAMTHADTVCPLHRGVIEGATGRPAILEAHPGGVCFVTPGA